MKVLFCYFPFMLNKTNNLFSLFRWIIILFFLIIILLYLLFYFGDSSILKIFYHFSFNFIQLKNFIFSIFRSATFISIASLIASISIIRLLLRNRFRLRIFLAFIKSYYFRLSFYLLLTIIIIIVFGNIESLNLISFGNFT